MDRYLVKSLSCPFCLGDLRPTHATETANVLDDVLECHCGKYPVLAGIPILKKDKKTVKLTNLIREGKEREALLTLLSPRSPSLAPAWIQLLPSVPGIRRLQDLIRQRELKQWKEPVNVRANQRQSSATALDLFSAYFRGQIESYNYNAFRFGQPRHLVSLCHTTLIERPIAAVLDLACGAGHTTRSLISRAQGRPVIGVDASYFSLYMAKHWIAPQGEFICCSADESLPFPDNFFAASFCSDAFHYFARKVTCIRELRRVTRQSGLLILCWLNNGLMRHQYDGTPLSPEGYAALVAGIPHRFVSDNEVLTRYLHKTGPDLSREINASDLSHERTFSLVVSENPVLFREHGVFETWPHAEGNLALNPLYSAVPEGSRTIKLFRDFPSSFYEQEHSECKKYMPKNEEIETGLLTRLQQRRETAEVQKLIANFVVLGIPERYCHAKA